MDKRLINWLNESLDCLFNEGIKDQLYALKMALVYKRNPEAEAKLLRAALRAIELRWANKEREQADKFLQERNIINKTTTQHQALVCIRFITDYFQSQGNLRDARINLVAPHNILLPALKQPEFNDQTYENGSIIKEQLSCIITYPTKEVAEEILTYVSNTITSAFKKFISLYKSVNQQTSHVSVYIPQKSKTSVEIDFYLEKYKLAEVKGQTEPNNEWQERVIDEFTDELIKENGKISKNATYRYLLKRRPGVPRGFFIYDAVSNKVVETNLPVLDEKHAVKYFQSWCEATLRIPVLSSLPSGEFVLVKIPYKDVSSNKKSFRYMIQDKNHEYYSYEIDTQDPNVAVQEFELWMGTNRIIDKSPDGKYYLVRQRGLDNKFRIVFQTNGEYRNKDAKITATRIPEAKEEFLQWCQESKLKDAQNFDAQGGHKYKRRGQRR